MMDTKHTPGPWAVEQEPYIHVRAKDGSQSGWGECVLASDYTTEANARLISSAPDLLAFAMALDADWTKEFPDGPDTAGVGFKLAEVTVALWRQCRAAIAKATDQ